MLIHSNYIKILHIGDKTYINMGVYVFCWGNSHETGFSNNVFLMMLEDQDMEEKCKLSKLYCYSWQISYFGSHIFTEYLSIQAFLYLHNSI